jgi:hypothetical protein
MMELLLLAPRAGSPAPIWIPLVLFPLVFLGGSLLSSRLLGVFQLYRDFPADQVDPIETNLGWIQIEFGVWRGHSPMSMKAGRRCLHIKQPFPFQPLFWLGPASIPWEQIRVVKEAGTDWWAFWKAAEFALGPEDRRIRIRGRAARKVQAQVEARQGRAGNLPLPTAAIRPR